MKLPAEMAGFLLPTVTQCNTPSMAQTNAAFALQTLGQWCRSHGIYEVRDTLAKAAHLAAEAESSELLAAALEEAAIAADVVVCPAPIPAPAPASAPAEDDDHAAESSPAKRSYRGKKAD
jgi:hypothetical protein